MSTPTTHLKGGDVDVLCGVCGDTVTVRQDHKTYDAIDHALDEHRGLLLDEPWRVWFYVLARRTTPPLHRERQQ